MILGEKANQLVWQHIAMEFSSKTLSDQVAPKMVVYKHMDTQTDICIVCKNYGNHKSTTLPTCYSCRKLTENPLFPSSSL